MTHTGMRINEMLDLRLGDLDFASDRLITAAPKNCGRPEKVVLQGTEKERRLC